MTLGQHRPSSSPSWWGRISAWAGLGGVAAPVNDEPSTQIHVRVAAGYQLVSWPNLPATQRSVKLLQALSVMSHRSVTARWFALQLSWPLERASRFLEDLADAGMARRLR